MNEAQAEKVSTCPAPLVLLSSGSILPQQLNWYGFPVNALHELTDLIQQSCEASTLIHPILWMVRLRLRGAK